MRRRVFALAWPTTKKYWHLILLVGGAGFALGAIATMRSLESTVINLVSEVVSNPSTEVWQAPIDVNSIVDDTWIGDLISRLGLETLVQVLLAYAVLTLLGAALTVATASAREFITQRAFVLILDRAADAAAESDLDERKWAHEPGGLAGAIQPGARSLAGASALIVDAVQYLFALFAVSLALVKVGLGFGLAFLGLLLLLVAVSVVQGLGLSARRKAFDKQRAKLFARTTEVLDNKEVLLAHERKDRFLGQLHTNAEELARVDRRLVSSESAFGATASVITDAGRLGILALVVYFAVHGADVDSVGDGYFYVALFARVVSPIRGILGGFDELFRSTAMSTTLLDVVDNHDSSPGKGGQKPAPQGDIAQPAIALENVSFAYDDRVVLNDVSLLDPPRRTHSGGWSVRYREDNDRSPHPRIRGPRAWTHSRLRH